MEELFRNQWLWTIVLGVALYLPVRHLIFALAVRREERKLGQAADASRRSEIKRRVSMTAALLCFVFAVVYVHVMLNRIYGGT